MESSRACVLCNELKSLLISQTSRRCSCDGGVSQSRLYPTVGQVAGRVCKRILQSVGLGHQQADGLVRHLLREAGSAAPVSRACAGDRALMIYADNAHHFGLCAKLVNSMGESLSKALNSRGRATHEVLEASDLADCLGARVSMKAGSVACTP